MRVSLAHGGKRENLAAELRLGFNYPTSKTSGFRRRSIVGSSQGNQCFWMDRLTCISNGKQQKPSRNGLPFSIFTCALSLCSEQRRARATRILPSVNFSKTSVGIKDFMLTLSGVCIAILIFCSLFQNRT